MDLMYVKWISAVVLLILTLVLTALPPLVWRRNSRGNQETNSHFTTRLISLLSCAGGGVFMGTCLLHLFPEVQEQMDLVYELLGMKKTFPFAEFLLAFGFLTILLIEQMVLVFQQRNNTELPILSHQHSHSQQGVDNNVNFRVPPNYGTVSATVERVDSNLSVHEDRSSHSPIRSTVLVLALSVHSLFEGLAIGLESSAANVVRILVAVSIHKSVIAFTLGLNLMNSTFAKKSIAWSVSIFSIMSPMGTVIGSIITGLSHGLGLAIASAVLQGISAGTFVYVTFFEILPHEMNSMVDKLWKVLFLVLGFGGISLLVFYLPA